MTFLIELEEGMLALQNALFEKVPWNFRFEFNPCGVRVWCGALTNHDLLPHVRNQEEWNTLVSEDNYGDFCIEGESVAEVVQKIKVLISAKIAQIAKHENHALECVAAQQKLVAEARREREELKQLIPDPLTALAQQAE